MARSAARITEKRSKQLESLLRFKNIRVSVGVHDEPMIDPESGTPMIVIANAHEFGTEDLPQRSFIRRCADEDRVAHMARVSKIVFRNLDKEPSVVAKMIALVLESDFKKFIADGRVEPKLTPRTIELKGSDVPLKDRGTLQASIRGVGKVE